MPRQPKSPLTDSHLKTLNKVIASCTDTEEYCNRCASCGLNVDPERKRNAEQKQLAERLKAAFFPNAK